jgi:hypothetical protein
MPVKAGGLKFHISINSPANAEIQVCGWSKKMKRPREKNIKK